MRIACWRIYWGGCEYKEKKKKKKREKARASATGCSASSVWHAISQSTECIDGKEVDEVSIAHAK